MFEAEPLVRALDAAAGRGRRIDVWLRDDDAVAVTPALDRLASLCAARAMPILLAVIPDDAASELASFVAAHPHVTPTQHGIAHRNHAAAGERARELGGMRPTETILHDLRRAANKMRDLFGPRLTDILVPPWNRIDESLLPALPAIGFGALSTFGPPSPGSPGLQVINCNLDIIDWRNGRRCHRPEKLIGKLHSLVTASAETGAPIGFLTHHLVHDEAAWTFLETCLDLLADHNAVRFASADAFRRRAASA